MNRNVGASFSLSVLTVLTFAVILYEPDRPPANATLWSVDDLATVEVVEALPPSSIGPQASPGVGPAAVRNPFDTTLGPATRLTPNEFPKIVHATEPASATRGTNPMTRQVSSRRAGPGFARPPQGPTARNEPKTFPPPASPAVATGPKGDFARARAGESLADIAARVYGDRGRAEALWRANRDALDSPAGQVPEGALLRTP